MNGKLPVWRLKYEYNTIFVYYGLTERKLNNTGTERNSSIKFLKWLNNRVNFTNINWMFTKIKSNTQVHKIIYQNKKKSQIYNTPNKTKPRERNWADRKHKCFVEKLMKTINPNLSRDVLSLKTKIIPFLNIGTTPPPSRSNHRHTMA